MLNNAPTKNPSVLAWLEDKINLVNPDKVVWIDGSEEQLEALRAEACATGEMIKLNQELLPDCYLHRTAVNDVARVEGRTFICTSKKEDAGNINNWMDPAEMYDKLYKLYLKQAKKQAAQMKQAKKEREQMQDQMRKILNDEQWADYQKMQKRHKFGWRKPMPHPARPDMRPAKGPWEKPQQGPKIEMPESRRNNMFIEK